MSENSSIQTAHRAGIDLSYRAPDLPDDERDTLPQPFLPRHPDWIELYWRAWSIAFDKIRRPPSQSGLVPFCDAAFSENIFQWDTCFMAQFLCYASGKFQALGSLSNFYRKQHPDGFICREINSTTGLDFWGKDHPSAINPPLFADAEWRLYQVHAKTEHLAEVLTPLTRLYDWICQNRRAGQGFWTTALGSGMDNSPRATAREGEDAHGHFDHVWVCMTAQQGLAALCISQMAAVLGRDDLARRFREEADAITRFVRQSLWNPRRGCYSDLAPDGQISDVMTPAMCWPLLLPDIPNEHRDAVAARLLDKRFFWRPHAIPSLSADNPLYDPRGHYWRGSVWPPMVQLAARAMQTVGRHDVAVRIAENHLHNISAVLRQTGTLWENYAPEEATPGDISRPEFVGWTGCGAIALLIDTVLGFEVQAPRRRVIWRLHRDDDHGVANLPLADDRITLRYHADARELEAQSRQEFCLHVRRQGEEQVFPKLLGNQRIRLS